MRICLWMSSIFDRLCSKPKIILASLSKSNCSMIIMATEQFAIFRTVFGDWETKSNIKITSINVCITSATSCMHGSLGFNIKCEISKVIFSLTYPPKSFYFHFISLIMNPSSFLNELAEWETSKFEIYFATNLSVQHKICDYSLQKIFV
jgi:hypothetical protein